MSKRQRWKMSTFARIRPRTTDGGGDDDGGVPAAAAECFSVARSTTSECGTLRLRPPPGGALAEEAEDDGDGSHHNAPSGNFRRCESLAFAFDHVFDTRASQEAVYEKVAKGLVKGVLNGQVVMFSVVSGGNPCGSRRGWHGEGALSSRSVLADIPPSTVKIRSPSRRTR